MLAGSFLEGNKDRIARALLIGLIWRLFRCCRSSYAATPIARTAKTPAKHSAGKKLFMASGVATEAGCCKIACDGHAGLSSADRDDDALCAKECPRERVCDIYCCMETMDSRRPLIPRRGRALGSLFAACRTFHLVGPPLEPLGGRLLSLLRIARMNRGVASRFALTRILSGTA